MLKKVPKNVKPELKICSFQVFLFFFQLLLFNIFFVVIQMDLLSPFSDLSLPLAKDSEEVKEGSFI